MASYSYTRDLKDEDLAPPEVHVYTKKELWENWWDYNLKWVLMGIGAVAILVYFLVDAFILTPKVDYQIAIISADSIYDSTLTDISDSLSPYLEDTTGDGVVTLDVYSYVVDLSTYSTVTEATSADGEEVVEEIAEAATEETTDETEADSTWLLDLTGDTSTYSYYTELAGQVQMSADLEACDTIIFILADPLSFQIASEMLCYPDGTMPEDPTDVAWEELVYAVEDCDVLSDATKEALSGYYIARRGSDTDSTVISQFTYYETLWDALVQGAAPYAETLAQ